MQAKELTDASQANRFRSSLGSRLVQCTCHPNRSGLLVTGTPGNGAHTPWLFDIQDRKWSKLPDAPYPILSSAVMVSSSAVTIAGGWSKAWSCHGYVQTLHLHSRPSWEVDEVTTVPWRRPGAGVSVAGRAVLALGWMECTGQVGATDFRLLKRNGGAQRAHTSSSRLCALSASGGQGISEICSLPFADSFEHNGELYAVSNDIVCIGRDHVQIFNMPQSSWKTIPLPRELGSDNSSSWVKHCGSWALAFTR